MSNLLVSDLEYEDGGSTALCVAKMMLLSDEVRTSLYNAEGVLIQRLEDVGEVVNAKNETADDVFMTNMNQALDALVHDATRFGTMSRVSVQSLVDEMVSSGCRDMKKEEEIASLQARLKATECLMKERDEEIAELRHELAVENEDVVQRDSQIAQLRESLALTQKTARENEAFLIDKIHMLTHEEIPKLRHQLAVENENVVRRDSQIAQLCESLALAEKTARGNEAFLKEKIHMLEQERQHWEWEWRALKVKGQDVFDCVGREGAAVDAIALEVTAVDLEYENSKIKTTLEAMQSKMKAMEAELTEYRKKAKAAVAECTRCESTRIEADRCEAAANHIMDGLEDMVLKLEAQLSESNAALEDQACIAAHHNDDLERTMRELKQRLNDDTVAHEETQEMLLEEMGVWKIRALGGNSEADVGVGRAPTAPGTVGAATRTLPSSLSSRHDSVFPLSRGGSRDLPSRSRCSQGSHSSQGSQGSRGYRDVERY